LPNYFFLKHAYRQTHQRQCPLAFILITCLLVLSFQKVCLKCNPSYPTELLILRLWSCLVHPKTTNCYPVKVCQLSVLIMSLHIDFIVTYTTVIPLPQVFHVEAPKQPFIIMHPRINPYEPNECIHTLCVVLLFLVVKRKVSMRCRKNIQSYLRVLKTDSLSSFNLLMLMLYTTACVSNIKVTSLLQNFSFYMSKFTV